MYDITKCVNEECKMKDSCLRYTMKAADKDLHDKLLEKLQFNHNKK